MSVGGDARRDFIARVSKPISLADRPANPIRTFRIVLRRSPASRDVIRSLTFALINGSYTK